MEPEFSEFIKRLISTMEQGTQSDICRLTDVSEAEMSRWINGVRDLPAPKVLSVVQCLRLNNKIKITVLDRTRLLKGGPDHG